MKCILSSEIYSMVAKLVHSDKRYTICISKVHANAKNNRSSFVFSRLNMVERESERERERETRLVSLLPESKKNVHICVVFAFVVHGIKYDYDFRTKDKEQNKGSQF